MIDFNPVTFTAKPKLIDRPPEIFAVDELRALLEAAQRTQPRVVPMLAIGAFAGLRDAERVIFFAPNMRCVLLADVLEGREEICPGLWSYRQELTWSDNLILFTESNIALRRCQ